MAAVVAGRPPKGFHEKGFPEEDFAFPGHPLPYSPPGARGTILVVPDGVGPDPVRRRHDRLSRPKHLPRSYRKAQRRAAIDADCREVRPQRSEDTAAYRKHDWPNSLAAPEAVQGCQASDLVVLYRGARTLIVQTFDFGTGGRVFGRFDGGLGQGGDGGQVLMLVDDWSSAAMTEDGGWGVHWFMGEAYRSPVATDRRFLGWLMFRNEVRGDAWNSVVARLNIAASPELRPRQFNAAFTRYRLDRITFPFRIIDAGSRVTTTIRRLDVVVSEHYGGTDIGSADHLERFFPARRFGLVRWEWWSNQGVARHPGDAETAARLAGTARCPKLESSRLESPGLDTPGLGTHGQPGCNWLRVDCRTWTALVRQTLPWSVDRYDWTELEIHRADFSEDDNVSAGTHRHQEVREVYFGLCQALAENQFNVRQYRRNRLIDHSSIETPLQLASVPTISSGLGSFSVRQVLGQRPARRLAPPERLYRPALRHDDLQLRFALGQILFQLEQLQLELAQQRATLRRLSVPVVPKPGDRLLELLDAQRLVAQRNTVRLALGQK